MSVFRICDLFARLMSELGYDRYTVRASDLGAGVAQQLAHVYPNTLIGLHISGTNLYLGEIP